MSPQALLAAIAAAIVPIFLVAAAGFGVRRVLPLDARTLSGLNIYLFIPALVFAKLSRAAITWSMFGRIAAAVCLVTALMWVLLGLVAHYQHIEGSDRSAFLMTMFPNLGNFGLPIALFAFGEEGLVVATVVMVCGSFVQNSLGLYFSQRSYLTPRSAFLHIFRYPMVYAFVLAMIFQRTAWSVPEMLFRAVDITADAAIPVQLMILGIKLAETRLETTSNVFLATSLRLIAAPAVASVVVAVIGLHGLPAQVFIVQMSGPVAVGMAAYAVQFNCRPGFMASVVSWTFLLSILTVSLLLGLAFTWGE